MGHILLLERVEIKFCKVLQKFSDGPLGARPPSWKGLAEVKLCRNDSSLTEQVSQEGVALTALQFMH